MVKRLLVVITLSFAWVLPMAPAARATFPGANGLIAFASDRSGNFDIWVMNAHGTNPVNLTNNPASDVEPSWSPDGIHIAFASDREDGFQIWVMKADGTDLLRVTNNGYGNAHNPTWSPDGTLIAYDKGGKINSADSRRCCREQGLVSKYHKLFDHPDWSASGTLIYDGIVLFGGRWKIYNGHAIKATSKNDKDPSWAPAENGIAFSSDVSGGWDLYTMRPDGSNHKRLTFLSSTLAMDPNWSPDGKKVAFFACCADGSNEIYVIGADGTGLVDISNDPASDTSPAWQPLP